MKHMSSAEHNRHTKLIHVDIKQYRRYRLPYCTPLPTGNGEDNVLPHHTFIFSFVYKYITYLTIHRGTVLLINLVNNNQ